MDADHSRNNQRSGNTRGTRNNGTSIGNSNSQNTINDRRNRSTGSSASADSSDINPNDINAPSRSENNRNNRNSIHNIANQNDSANTALWKEDLSNLLTPQTVVEQAQVRRRKRNREAARRSRQRQKEREQELVKRQDKLSTQLKSLEQELVEVLVDSINNVYALTMQTLQLIGVLQLQLDEITTELNSIMGSD
ncbi:hypothetical protein BX661DRAFT_196168 [Kickxella alabastrina]|uniref:uncharacterized protein n=1 Tax=Kickxella alabastrina TaxID=61397 RepID=UPI00221EBE00|nr:uncharacterized protein BX661DRAFT_196168 [Kickxella alabastrina]KAI7833649.1 hypothetical protein BX661DRAFT_196168 [Kickxella alabastrina]